MRGKRTAKPKPEGFRKDRIPIAAGEIDVLKVFVRSALGNDGAGANAPTAASFGNIRVDFVRHELFKEGKRLRANAREFQLLKYFLAHEGEVVPRERLLKDVWGFDETPETRSVDNYILSLRKKIEDDAAHPVHILTFRGAGYKFTR